MRGDPDPGVELYRMLTGTKPTLRARERDVIEGLAAGETYVGIGQRLFLSPDTVRGHAQRAMKALGARTRAQAVAIALREGLIE